MIKKTVIDILQRQAAPIKRADLLRTLKFFAADDTITDRELRRAVEEMITQDGELIASSEKGYAIIETEDDLKTAMDYLNAKAAAIAVRKNCLLKNWRAKNGCIAPSLFDGEKTNGAGDVSGTIYARPATEGK